MHFTRPESIISTFNQGGDGLCCTAGQGKYSLYSRGKLLFVGNAFEAMQEHSVSIDPTEFLQNDGTSNNGGTVSGGATNSTNASSNTTVAQWNTPTMPSPTVRNTSPTVLPAPTAKPVTPSAQLSADQDRWYCGSSWDWVVQNCADAVPCPGGDFSGECF